ncbi:MAG TPA: amidohydrolase family protein [Candidatus Eisenbacteria bacterium]|nr:amidohydrolase family protein [Candidatus Eisenbacteria bacterium]
MPAGSEVVVDADGHVCEPPDLWERGLPQRFRDRALRLRWNAESGYDEAWVEDWMITDRGLVGLGNAGTSFADLGKGRRYVEGSPAGFDPAARLRVLDEEGIDVAVLYGGLALSLPAIHDPELAVWHCRIYNDWIASFCATNPGRLVGAAALPLQDPVAAIAEARRAVGELGLRAAFTRPNPTNPCARPLFAPALEPIWSALEELGIPLAFHPAGLWDMPGTSRAMAGLMAPGTHHAVILFFDQYMTLANLVYAGVLERHPRLTIGVLECGGGWLPHWMDRLDEFTESYGWQLLGLSMKPSEYVRRQVYVSFDPGEHTMSALGPLIGEDAMIWASDFPHSDAKYPGVVRELREHTADMTPAARVKLLGTNALRLYGIRPA